MSCVASVQVQLIFTPQNVIGMFYLRKSAANWNERPDLTALYLLQGWRICGSAAQRKLDAILFLQGHRWGIVWSLLAGIDLQRWVIMWVWFDAAEHPLLSRMMTLPSPVPAVTIDGWTEHFPPPLLFTDIPDPTSADASAISGRINHPSCPVIGLKSWSLLFFFSWLSYVQVWWICLAYGIALILREVTNVSWQPSLSIYT